MKRLCLWFLSSALVVPAALATTNFINYADIRILAPPQAPPQVDASNFVNYGTIFITNNSSFQVTPSAPYQTWNTRNWTNAGQMVGDSGFLFNYYDSAGQTNGPSANFQNAVSVNNSNASIFGSYYLKVAATNISSRGSLSVGGTGLLSLGGKHIDISRSTLGASGTESNNLAGVRDLYWGTEETTAFGFYNGTTVQSPSTLATTITYPPGLPPMYSYFFQSLRFTNYCGTNAICTNGFTTYITTNFVFFHGDVYRAIDVLFLRQTNPAISTEVRFGDFGNPGAQKVVQWRSVLTNRVNGALSTNSLYLQDTFGYWFFPPTLVRTPSPTTLYNIVAADRFHPQNYSITHAAPAGYDLLQIAPRTFVDTQTFSGTNFNNPQTNVAWAATLTAAAFPPDPTVQNSSWTNTPGRIEVAAAGPGSTLDLTRTVMDGQSYLLLSATNHFIGASNAAIISPVTDVYLASTNGIMAVSNLTRPYCPRMEGQIQVWSGRWTNANALGEGALYTVTIIDSDLNEKPAAQVQNLNLRSTNLLIGDTLNVFDKLYVDAQRITISTNAANAPTARGELNLTSADSLWTANLPSLQYLTNNGQISCRQSIFFASNSLPPWITGVPDAPYRAVVNRGTISSLGALVWADYFENSGTVSAAGGVLAVQAATAILTNGIFVATNTDISITAGSLLISNQVLQAGRGLNLTVTNYLDDGSLSNSVDVITNKNTWTVSAGMTLPLLPTAGASLLGTSITNKAFANAPVDNVWAGLDYGNATGGFVNNAALGRLVLDGQDASVFNFVQPDPNPTNAHALYVDLLELKGAAARADGQGNFEGINLQTNFTIYYGDAVWNGMSIAEQLNGRFGEQGVNGGRFIWVSNYNTGFFSSTNITYTDGSGVVRLNRALALSCTLDSNNNGIPNCLDPNPVTVFTSSSVALKGMLQSKPSRSMVLSWSTVPGAQNYVYGSWTLPPSANWQLIDQFSSSATETRVTRTYDIPGSGTMYYRVRVVSP